MQKGTAKHVKMYNFEVEKKTALLHSKQRRFKKLCETTHNFIQQCILSIPAEKIYCACSFGKDSSVMLHLLQQHCKDIKTVFVCYPETNMLDNYDEVISKWDCNLLKLFLDVDVESTVNEKNIIPKWAIENGYVLGFVGIRAEESKPRRITLMKHGMYYRYENSIMYRAAPLAWWSTEDIAAYTYLHQLPTLNTYKHSGMMSRTTSGLADDNFGFRSAQLLRLKQTDIFRYNKLIAQYPQLAVYA